MCQNCMTFKEISCSPWQRMLHWNLWLTSLFSFFKKVKCWVNDSLHLYESSFGSGWWLIVSKAKFVAVGGSETWWDMIGRNGPPGLNQTSVPLLDFCASRSLSRMNTMFRHKDQRTWHWGTLGRRSMIDFVVLSSDFDIWINWKRRRPGQTWQAQVSSEGLLGTSGLALGQGRV